MKRVYIIFVLLGFLLGLSGCGKEEKIVFPFDLLDVECIESYYDNGESEIQKKTLSEESDIDNLYTYFSELSVKAAQESSAEVGYTVKFVFNLADGTDYEITYTSVATKKGCLQSETAGFDYSTSSDVVGVWESLSGEIELIPTGNIPQ